MEVAQYTYQSPYTSPVQFGRANPSSQKEQNSAAEQLPNTTNETVAKAQQFEASQTQEVKPSVVTNTLDLYA